jgi:phosphomannomutase
MQKQQNHPSPTPNIKFGTDGWRGVMADDFTFANVRLVAQAIADYWSEKFPKNKNAIVGYDRRFMSETYARLVAEVLAANGFRALYPPEAVPTPAVTYAIHDKKLCGAVMITASHNPPAFNGVKIKADYAGPADPEICKDVEKKIGFQPVKSLDFDKAVSEKSIEIYDPRPAHIKKIRGFVNFDAISDANLRVVVDSMHGVGSNILENLLKPTKNRVETIRENRDVYFGGVPPEPIGKNLRPLCDAVKKSKAHIGLATDGDADRIGGVDDKGEYLSIQMLFSMLLLHLIRHHKETGLVVKSSNSSVWIDRICQKHGLKFVEVPVGFKHICEKMRANDVLIGGEESGGIGFRGHIPERDGLLAGLMLLEMLAVTKKSVTQIAADIEKEFGARAYDRIDTPYPLEKRVPLVEWLQKSPPKTLLKIKIRDVKTFDGVKFIAENDDWLMFRTSGTEPIIRIYAESDSSKNVAALLKFGRTLAESFAKAGR